MNTIWNVWQYNKHIPILCLYYVKYEKMKRNDIKNLISHVINMKKWIIEN